MCLVSIQTGSRELTFFLIITSVFRFTTERVESLRTLVIYFFVNLPFVHARPSHPSMRVMVGGGGGGGEREQCSFLT